MSSAISEHDSELMRQSVECGVVEHYRSISKDETVSPFRVSTKRGRIDSFPASFQLASGKSATSNESLHSMQ